MPKNHKSEIEFECRKCNHLLFVTVRKGWLDNLIDFGCPNCGEEPPIWLLVGYGSYKDYTGPKL